MGEKENAKAAVASVASNLSIRKEYIPVLESLRELNKVVGNIAICDGKTYVRAAGTGGWVEKPL